MSKAFGEQNPTQGEDAVSWQTWSNGAGSVPEITGNADWGKLHLDYDGVEGRSAVYDLGSSHSRKFTLTENRYGSGMGTATLQIRGDTSSFGQDDASPSWEDYTASMIRTWQYVQIRETISPYPLKVSSNLRYLTDVSGNPVLIKGDSIHAMFANISLTAAETYFESRAADGINAVWAQLLPSTYSNISPGWKTYDNIAPFSWDGSDPLTFDLASPNESYFARIDDMIKLAEQYGICVFLDPTETGGWLDIFKANSQADRQGFGTYVGNRYKSFHNIVWQHCNDFQTWSTLGDDNAVLDIVQYLHTADPNHLVTMQLDYDASESREDSRWDSYIDIDTVYSYYPQYDLCLVGYARTGPVMPVSFIEGVYENQQYQGGYSGPHELRVQEYWTLLSGACAHFWGNADLYPFAEGWDDAGWDTTQGFLEWKICYDFFETIDWQNLVPDPDHDVLTAGYGTYETSGLGNTSDYCTCAWLTDGSLVLAYMPVAQTMTIDMSKMRGTTTARWFDPTNGQFYTDAASPLSNSGTHDFSRPGVNSYGEHDWMLVLEA